MLKLDLNQLLKMTWSSIKRKMPKTSNWEGWGGGQRSIGVDVVRPWCMAFADDSEASLVPAVSELVSSWIFNVLSTAQVG